VSLLLDENLSPRLVQRLSSLFPGLAHVRDIGLKRESDRCIWMYAKENGYTVVTADSILLLSRDRAVRFPLAIIEDLLRRNTVRIAEFEARCASTRVADSAITAPVTPESGEVMTKHGGICRGASWLLQLRVKRRSAPPRPSVDRATAQIGARFPPSSNRKESSQQKNRHLPPRSRHGRAILSR
jgi:predicted nuclease of predicted toxin-antitoxin system